METEVVVTKKGQTTIPARLRKKFKIEEGTRLEVVETEEGILFKPKKSIWDMAGAYSQFATPEEMKKNYLTNSGKKMNRTVYDTRFFVELYYSKDEALLKKIKEEKARKEKYVSAVVTFLPLKGDGLSCCFPGK